MPFKNSSYASDPRTAASMVMVIFLLPFLEPKDGCMGSWYVLLEFSGRWLTAATSGVD